jgi:hypothetical protein
MSRSKKAAKAAIVDDGGKKIYSLLAECTIAFVQGFTPNMKPGANIRNTRRPGVQQLTAAFLEGGRLDTSVVAAWVAPKRADTSIAPWFWAKLKENCPTAGEWADEPVDIKVLADAQRARVHPYYCLLLYGHTLCACGKLYLYVLHDIIMQENERAATLMEGGGALNKCTPPTIQEPWYQVIKRGYLVMDGMHRTVASNGVFEVQLPTALPAPCALAP